MCESVRDRLLPVVPDDPHRREFPRMILVNETRLRVGQAAGSDFIRTDRQRAGVNKNYKF